MAIFKFIMKALRPKDGPLSKMVGSSALSQIAQLKSGGLTLPQLQEITGEAITGLQDQINALNTILKMNGVVEVNGDLLPFTPPGGTSGQIQTNDGSGGFAGLSSTGSGAAVRETAPTIASPVLTGTTSLAGAGGADGLIRSHPTLGIIELGSVDSSDVSVIVNGTERFRFIVGGALKAPSLPSADPGAGSLQIWYDPADGNRVKFAP